MNRRDFFKSLSSAVAGVYVACHVNLGALAESVAKSVKPAAVAINPEWVNAPYELAFLCDPNIPLGSSRVFAFENARILDRDVIVNSIPNGTVRPDPSCYPMRGSNNSVIQPFIEL